MKFFENTENKKIKHSELLTWNQQGWERGRVYDFDNVYYICVACGLQFRNLFAKQTCSSKCRKKIRDEQLGGIKRIKKSIKQFQSGINTAKSIKIFGGARNKTRRK